jgi:hypothetical protein
VKLVRTSALDLLSVTIIVDPRLVTFMEDLKRLVTGPTPKPKRKTNAPRRR